MNYRERVSGKSILGYYLFHWSLVTSFSHHSSAKRSQVDLGHQKLRAEGSSAARWKLLVLHQSRERGWNKRTERSCSHFHQRWQTSRQYLYPFLLKDHFNFIIRPLLIHFRDKVPAAQRLGSPCSGAVSGPDHPALLLRRAWEHHTCRRRVSFSLLTTFLSPAIFKSHHVSRCPSILGELLLPRGRYYWETIVSRSTAYRLGVAYSTASRSSPLGENRLSWCLQCVPAMSGCVFVHLQTFLYSPQSFWTHFIFLYSFSLSLSCRYQLLHINIRSSLFVTETPERVGTLLDYQLGRLSFYNAQSGQLLGTFCQQFTQPCHPALALEMPGSLEVSMVLKMPDFIKNS